MRLLSSIILLIFISASTACTTMPDAPVSDVRSLGIVSAVGDEFKVITVGTTVFGNADSVGDVTDWNIDGTIIKEIKQHLDGRYQIYDVAYDATGIRADYTSDMSSFWNPKFDVSASLKRNVPALSNSANEDAERQFDALLIIAPAMHNSYGLRGSPELVGPGMYSAKFLTRETMLFIGAQLILVDAESLEEKRRRMFLPGKFNTPRGEQKCDGCFLRKVSNDLYAKRFSELTDSQQDAIRAELMLLIKDSVGHTLAMSGLLSSPESAIASADGSTKH